MYAREKAISSLGTNSLLKTHWLESLSSPSPYLSIVFFCTSEEEAKSEGNKRTRFPPLGLGECRISEWSKTKWILWPLREKILWGSAEKKGRGERRMGGRRGKGGEGLEKPHSEEKTVFAHLWGRRSWEAADSLASRQMGYFLCSKLGLGWTERMGSLCTIQWFMNYVAECWWSCMMTGIFLASLYSGDNECFIA